MIRLFLFYCKSILKTNLIFSILFTVLKVVLTLEKTTDNFPYSLVLSSLIVSLLTGGFLISILYFQVSRKNEYYFYFNLGISQVKLIGVAYLFHLILVTPLLILRFYV